MRWDSGVSERDRSSNNCDFMIRSFKSAVRPLLLPVMASLLTCGGCVYPHDKPNVEYASVPFVFGAPEPVEITANLRARGTYHLYFILNKDSLPQDSQGRTPLWLDILVHVLVLTNGQKALDETVSRLYGINRVKDLSCYSLTLFSGEANDQVVCRAQDMGSGDCKASGSLNLQQMRHH
jgi:hypothetical protein